MSHISGEPKPAAVEAGESEQLPIHAVERATGIPKELLRMWERRYGFPSPKRNTLGERVYPREQIIKLGLIRRLIDGGFRPGKIMGLDIAGLEAMCVVSPQGNRHILASELEQELLNVLRHDDPAVMEGYLRQQLQRRGLFAFVMDFMRMANVVVGDAWMTGKITVAMENRYAEQIHVLMRETMSALPPGVLKPRVMLATVPEEQHTLGLLMVEALLRLDGVDVLNYGAEMPQQEMIDAAIKQRRDVVGLSFSSSFAPNRAVLLLEELRLKLPRHIDIWAGGNGVVSSRRAVANVDIVRDLEDVTLKVARWRQKQAEASVRK